MKLQVKETMARFRPFQNPHFKKTKEMRPSVMGQAHRSVKRNDSPGVDDEVPQEIKSPWLRRVLKRLGKQERD